MRNFHLFSVRIPGYSSTYDVHALPNGIEYYGDSLQRGECGILFSSLRSTNLGKFQCNMTIGGEVFEQSIVIEAALSPEPTDLSIGEDTIVEQGAFAPNQTLRVTCSSRNANPASNLTWLLDEDPIDPSYLGPVETSENADSKGRNLVSVSQQLNYYITLKDHGRKIVCRAEHFAIQKGFFRGFLPLNFRCKNISMVHPAFELIQQLSLHQLFRNQRRQSTSVRLLSTSRSRPIHVLPRLGRSTI